VLTQHTDLVLRAVIDTHLELGFVDSGPETVPAGVLTWFTVYLNDTDHNEGIAGANLTILGVEHASYVDMSQSVGPGMAGYYNITVWSSEISGDQSFRIKAYASHSLFGGGDVTFYLKVTKRPVNPEVFTQVVSVTQGEDAIFTFAFKDGISNSTLEDVLVSFFWERDLGELEYVEDEGVWRLVINTGDVEPDQFLITVSFFVDPNYDDGTFDLTLIVNEKPPREGIPLWAFIAFTLVVGFVSAGATAWLVHFRKPWIVRRIEGRIKALEKGDITPPEGLSREETVKGLMEKDFKIIKER
ncbi:MAG: LapA family protein, partial [Candidatus Hodarchaeota archaeon]